jgi:serine phosphatase RsbU (regulator of sigma subunit)
MARLVLTTENGEQKAYPLQTREFILGRHMDSDCALNSRDVSRRHARITLDGDRHFIEDLGSSNGTYVNSKRINGRMLLQEWDQIQIGPFALKFELRPTTDEQPIVIRATEPAHTSNTNLFRLDAPRKLQVVLELAQQLANTLELEELLPRLLDHLFLLFPQADRGMILMMEGDEPRVRFAKSRLQNQSGESHFSRSVVRRVLSEGVGIVAEDATMDQRFLTQTINHLGIRSFVAVPFKTRAGQPLGLVILDRFGIGNPFTTDDLHLLTATALQASVVFENATLHQKLLTKARLERDLALAREIQQGFLPQDLPPVALGRLEHYACVDPAQGVAGDFYDFFAVGESHLAFSVADISGKGIPSALLMTGIRTLSRHLGMQSHAAPAEVLQRINDSLAADNPYAMFVTMALGTFNCVTGEVQIASGGHPTPLLRRANGKVEEVAVTPGRILGIGKGNLNLTNTTLHLDPQDTLVLYTDGVTEARAPDGKTLFGVERLTTTVRNLPATASLDDWGHRIRQVVDDFMRTDTAQDDFTLLILRRLAEAPLG